jgi:hypothetical protein
MLSAEQIKKFQVLYEQRFGKRISKQEAYEVGSKLVALVKLACTATSKTHKKRDERNQHDKEKNPNAI